MAIAGRCNRQGYFFILVSGCIFSDYSQAFAPVKIFLRTSLTWPHRWPLSTTTGWDPSRRCKNPFNLAEAALPLDTSSCRKAANQYLAELNTTITFPLSYAELMVLSPGAFVASDTITLASAEGSSKHFEFRVQLYPRGTDSRKNTWLGKTTNKKQGGFGMSYAVPPILSNAPSETVAVYLQFLPQTPDQWVDASFALRLLGRQQTRRRFDVEWRAGMRFVAAIHSKLAEGRANDFGGSLMATPLLASFLGVTEDNYFDLKDPIQLQVEIRLHTSPSNNGNRTLKQDLNNGRGPFALTDVRLTFNNRAGNNTDNLEEHDQEQVRVGRVIVPVLRRLSERPAMFEKGAYPGVEYRILRMVDPATGKDLFYSQPGADYDLKPIYPLVAQLERTWPVTVNERDIPKLYTPNMYNAVSAMGSLITALTGLLTALVISQAISLFYIPSRSMDPALAVGDVLLVEKVSPRLLLGGGRGYHPGDVVLFSPPKALQAIVAQSGGRVTIRDLFVKRIAAESGDRVTVDPLGLVQINGVTPSGRRDLCIAEPLGLIQKFMPQTSEETTVPPGNLEVLGDCSSVSIDSRVWGPLPKENIIGRPIVRLWPLSKFGPVPSLPTSELK